MKTRVVLVHLVLLLALFVAPAMAARFIVVEVHLDGEVILTGFVEDASGSPTANIWRELVNARLSPVKGYVVESDRLQGVIELKLVWSRKILAQARLESLQLEALQGGSWRLTSEEVERTAIEAGLPERLPEPILDEWNMMIFRAALIVIGGLALVIGVIYLLLGRRKRPDPKSVVPDFGDKESGGDLREDSEPETSSFRRVDP